VNQVLPLAASRSRGDGKLSHLCLKTGIAALNTRLVDPQEASTTMHWSVIAPCFPSHFHLSMLFPYRTANSDQASKQTNEQTFGIFRCYRASRCCGARASTHSRRSRTAGWRLCSLRHHVKHTTTRWTTRCTTRWWPRMWQGVSSTAPVSHLRRRRCSS